MPIRHNHIAIWKPEQAPIEITSYLEKKYGNGIVFDDSDWLAYIPEKYKNADTSFLDEPVFGCCTVKSFPYFGDEIRIGYHS